MFFQSNSARTIPWYKEIAYKEPALFLNLFGASQQGAYLDYCPDDPRGRYAYICPEPVKWIEKDSQASTQDVWSSLNKEISQKSSFRVPNLPPFQGGIVGVLNYDLGHHFDVSQHFPKAGLGVYETIAAFDTWEKKAWLISHDSSQPEIKAQNLLDQLNSCSAEDLDTQIAWTGSAELSQDQFEAMVRQVIDHIYAGDIYQANISQRFCGKITPPLSPIEVYKRLRSLSPAPFGAFLNCGGGRWIASASPEQFLSLDTQNHIQTRPIKGTMPRYRDPRQDLQSASTLLNSPKDQAENLMIVDLMRNDLGKIAKQGSVTVSKLCGLESFVAVHHLVSVIEADLKEGLSAIDLLQATFPGGSITGAPKLKAMEIIASLETAPRGPFCGSIISLGFDGTLNSSIIIRSIIGSNEKVIAQAGCGIVADSDPTEEYKESMLKLRPLLEALDPKWNE